MSVLFSIGVFILITYMSFLGSPDTGTEYSDEERVDMSATLPTDLESFSSWDQARLDFIKHGYTVSDEQWPIIVAALEQQRIGPDQLIEKIVLWHNEFQETFPGFTPGRENEIATLMEGFHNLNEPILGTDEQ